MTLRTLFWLACLLIIGATLAWLSDQPGRLLLEWGDLRWELNPALGVSLLVATLASILVMLDTFRWILSAPRRWRENRRTRRELEGEDWLAKGFLAVSLGDRATLAMATKQASKRLTVNPLLDLLKAENALAQGKLQEARQYAQPLLSQPTTMAATHRLYMKMADHENRPQEAYAHALAWAEHCPGSSEAWQEAWMRADNEHDASTKSRLISKAARDKLLPTEDLNKRQAVLTLEHKEGESEDAQLNRARAALKLDATNAEAARRVAAHEASEGNIRTANKILLKAWQASPSLELGRAYIHLRAGDAPKDRLKRAQTLCTGHEGKPLADLLLAESFMACEEWEKAQNLCHKHEELALSRYLLGLIALKMQASAHDVLKHWGEAAALALHEATPNTEWLDNTATPQQITTAQHTNQDINRSKKSTPKSVPRPAVFPLDHMPDDPGASPTSQNLDDEDSPSRAPSLRLT